MSILLETKLFAADGVASNLNMTSVRSKNRDENFLYINTVQSYLGLGVFFVKSSPRAFAVKIKDQVSKTKKESTDNGAENSILSK